MEEIWKDIKGYEELYQVSNLGRVKSFKRGKERILGCGNKDYSYRKAILCKNNIRTTKNVHRLVAESFIPNSNNLPEVMHIDDNPANNNLSNLKWGTQADNRNDKISKNRQARVKGEDNGKSKLTTQQVIDIKNELISYKYGDNTKIANRYKVDRRTISKIKTGVNWAHV